MLWWFERAGQHTMIEVLHLPTGAYELRFVDAHGVEHIEQFGAAEELASHQQAAEDSLIAAGWSRSGEWLV